jgi:hypothetical protein
MFRLNSCKKNITNLIQVYQTRWSCTSVYIYKICLFNKILNKFKSSRAQLIFVNNQLDAQFFFMYVYFCSLHVSGSHVPLIRRINCINLDET